MRSIMNQAKVRALLERFCRATGANLTITFAFAAVPVLFALGATADYGFAVKTRARMNAAADAAVLTAVTPQEMAQTPAVAQLAATKMFLAQVTGLPRLTFDPTNSANLPQVQDQIVNGQRVRTATVRYKASSQTAFANIIHMPTIAIGGSSTASATSSPNIDFYLMLDTSPSMAIPATTDGINWMIANTPHQGGGCAFACHESNPSAESNGNPNNPSFGNPGCTDDPQKRPAPCQDNYYLAQHANPKVQVRMDLVAQAVSNLVTTAQSTSTQTGAAYQLAGYTFDVGVANPLPLQLPTAATQSQASNIQMLEVASENSNNGDMDTNFDAAFTTINTAMTQAYNGAGAGNGTNAAGDHPQQVLMIVTDGVADEKSGNNRIYTPLGATTNMSALTTQWCTNIKANSNVQIAVLYLVYNPLPSNGWYSTYIAPEQNEVAPVLKNCASSANLFTAVNTNGDISTAMSNLFSAAAKSGAHLTN